MAALLEANGLTKAFGGLVAVSNMSLAVSPGEVLGLIGPNGSGKTTLLNLIAGTIRCDAGTIRIGGEDVTRLPNHLRVRKRINRTFQLVRTPANMPLIATVMGGVLYGAGEFLSVQDYKNVQRWTDAIAKRPAVQRGRMVNRTWGDPASQLHERHDAGDFQTQTQDKIGEPVKAE